MYNDYATLVVFLFITFSRRCNYYGDYVNYLWQKFAMNHEIYAFDVIKSGSWNI